MCRHGPLNCAGYQALGTDLHGWRARPADPDDDHPQDRQFGRAARWRTAQLSGAGPRLRDRPRASRLDVAGPEHVHLRPSLRGPLRKGRLLAVRLLAQRHIRQRFAPAHQEPSPPARRRPHPDRSLFRDRVDRRGRRRAGRRRRIPAAVTTRQHRRHLGHRRARRRRRSAGATSCRRSARASAAPISPSNSSKCRRSARRRGSTAAAHRRSGRRAPTRSPETSADRDRRSAATRPPQSPFSADAPLAAPAGQPAVSRCKAKASRRLPRPPRCGRRRRRGRSRPRLVRPGARPGGG